jgi:hypothetical protein
VLLRSFITGYPNISTKPNPKATGLMIWGRKKITCELTPDQKIAGMQKTSPISGGVYVSLTLAGAMPSPQVVPSTPTRKY